MATRAAIRDNIRKNIINQPDSANSDYTDADLNILIDIGIRRIAALSQYPRTFQEDQAVLNQQAYSFASDAMIIRYAYFGDKTKQNDLKKLRILNENELRELRPSWLSSNVNDSGEPDTLLLYSRTQYYLSPATDSTNSASGKKVYISYVNYPADLSGDSSSPVIATVYHDLVPYKVGEFCFLGKLNNPDRAKLLKEMFMEEYKRLEISATQEVQDLHLSWGSYDDMDNEFASEVIPT